MNRTELYQTAEGRVQELVAALVKRPLTSFEKARVETVAYLVVSMAIRFELERRERCEQGANDAQ